MLLLAEFSVFKLFPVTGDWPWGVSYREVKESVALFGGRVPHVRATGNFPEDCQEHNG